MMLLGLNKDDGDRILEEFLLHISKLSGSVESAKESLEIMNDFPCSQLLLSLIIKKGIIESGNVPENYIELEGAVLSALASCYSSIGEEEVPLQFKGFFNGKNEDEIFEKIEKNRKLNFAVQAFVASFFYYDQFEKKYPEICKML